MVLSKEQLWADEEIVTDFPEAVTDDKLFDTTYQPNGIDLSLASVEEFINAGFLGKTTKTLPSTTDVKPKNFSTYYLQPGTYFVKFNETVKLPNDVMAYLRPRSTLLRSGVSLHTAVWDAGYEGKGGSLLVVYNAAGFYVEKNARIAQMVFHRLEQPAKEGYSGSYQREGLEPQPLYVDPTSVPPMWTVTAAAPLLTPEVQKQVEGMGEAIRNGPLFKDKKGWDNVMEQYPSIAEKWKMGE